MKPAVRPDELSKAVAAAVEALGYELVALERGGGRRRPLLRVRIDRPGGEPGHSTVGVDDCVTVSRALDEMLAEGTAGGTTAASSFILEVSSPGVERPLTKPGDFDRFAGQRVLLRGFAPLRGASRQLEGWLLGRVGDEGERVVLEVEDGRVEVSIDAVARAKRVYDWEESRGGSAGRKQKTARSK
jgi:ribosome maturation factor RimP